MYVFFLNKTFAAVTVFELLDAGWVSNLRLNLEDHFTWEY